MSAPAPRRARSGSSRARCKAGASAEEQRRKHRPRTIANASVPSRGSVWKRTGNAVGISGTARIALVPHTASTVPSTAAASASSRFSSEQQADDAPRPGAEREAHAHFALTRAGARQQQVRGVAADREQQEQHDALQHRHAPATASAAARAAHARTAAPRPSAPRWSRDTASPDRASSWSTLGLRPRHGARPSASRPMSVVAADCRGRRARAIQAAATGASVAGTHRSNCRPRTVPWNPSGVTPTTVSSRSFTRNGLADRGRGAGRSRVCQKSCETTTTAPPPAPRAVPRSAGEPCPPPARGRAPRSSCPRRAVRTRARCWAASPTLSGAMRKATRSRRRRRRAAGGGPRIPATTTPGRAPVSVRGSIR